MDETETVEETVTAAVEEHTPEPTSEPVKEAPVSKDPPSTEDSVRQAIEQIKQEKEKAIAPSEEEDKEEVKTEEPRKAEDKQETKEVKRGRPKSEDFIPPTDWDADGKEEFRKFPKTAQKNIARISSAYEKWRKQEINKIGDHERTLLAKEREIDGIRTVVQRFLPIWGSEGITPEQAITQICTFFTKCGQDPDAAILELAQSLKRDVEIKNKATNGIVHDPAFRELQSTVQSLAGTHRSQAESARDSHLQHVANRFDSAHENLKEQVNSEGKYIFPDLHDEEFVQQNVGPLAIGIAKANPNLAPEDVIKRAYRAAEGRVIPNTTPTTAKLNGRTTEAARRASASIPGNASGSSIGGDLEVIPGESVEQTVRRAFAAASR